MMGTEVMTEELTGMQRHLKHQNSLLEMERFTWKSWQQASRQRYM